LLKKLDVKFEKEIKREEFSNLYDFPNWFPICCFECSLFQVGPAYHGNILSSILGYGFFYHIVFLSLTLDYGCHSCKIYVSLAKEKSLNYICYFLVLLLKIQTSNLQTSDIIWFLKLETCKKYGFFHELSDKYVILENQLRIGLKTRVKSKKSLWQPN
jgi:hypothetical protein